MTLDAISWTNMPSPYQVERLNALAARGNLAFEGWFNEVAASDRSWIVDESEWEFRGRYVTPAGVRGVHVGVPKPLRSREPPAAVLASLYAEPCFILGSRYAAWRGAKTMYWCEVQYDSWRRRTALKEAVKRYLFKRVDGVHTTGADGAAYARQYGISTDRIFETPHVLEPEHYFRGAEEERRDGKVREKLGLQDRFVYLYVGRLVRPKGLEYLIRAFPLVRERWPDAVLLFVGDGVDSDVFRRLGHDLRLGDDFRMIDFVQKPDLPRYYGVAGCFVLASLGEPYGLVLDEAMAARVPVIAATSVGEIGTRIGGDLRGRCVPPYDVKSLAEAMIDVRARPRITEQQIARASEWVGARTPDLWAQRFEQAIEAIRAMPPRRQGPLGGSQGTPSGAWSTYVRSQWF